VPGAGRLAELASITRTQSLAAGGVKFLLPLFGNIPINVVCAVPGEYHQAFAWLPESEMALILMVIVVAFPLGT
jgi:hypothetical protein